ncbi:MAG: ABC transporter permease subunit, partial [Ilumatobacteraceae bacterium]
MSDTICVPRPGRRRARRLGLGLAAAAALLVSTGPSAHAQDDTGDTATTEIKGTLKTADDAGEEVLLEGVELRVTDATGSEIGSGVTGADGTWSLVVPGEGVYQVELLVDTLPEGVALRDGARNPVDVDLNEGDSRNTLFPMAGSARASDATNSNSIRALQLMVDGAKLGLIIAMCAIGLSLIYGTTGLTNFAHGEMVTFGAMIGYLFHMTGVFGWTTSLVVAALFATLFGGFGGFVFNEGVWRPLRNRGASLISALVVSIGFSIFLRYVMLYVFGGRDGFYRDYRIQERIDFGWFDLAPKDLWIMGISVLVLVGVASALQFTRIGKAMRAVADNRDLAESSGIDVERVIRWVWVSGSALAALGGVLFATTEAVGWEMGFRILLLMFAGVTLGGLGTAYGALFGGLVVGVFIQTSTLVIPSDLKNVGALLML